MVKNYKYFILFSFLIFIFVTYKLVVSSHSEAQNPNKNSTDIDRFDPTADKGSKNLLTRENKSTPSGFPSEDRDPKLIPQSDLIKLQREFETALQKAESERTTLLSQKTWKTDTGKEEWYLIGISPPSKSEIEAVREHILRLEEIAKGKYRDSNDELIGSLIETYDPFGRLGKRAAIIKIPENPKQRMTALVYRASDFEAEKSKIDPENPFNYQLDSLKIYVRDDFESLHRFKKIIKE